MKAKHKQTVKQQLPAVLPQLESIIQAVPGLEDFKVQSLTLRHIDDIIDCSGQPGTTPCRVWNGHRYVWTCKPIGSCR
jgi:hypothetical protein